MLVFCEFLSGFAKISKSNEISILRIHSKPDRNSQKLSVCPAHFSATSDVTYIRHINPLRENRDNVVEDLSDRLRQKFPLQYSFLSKDLQFEVEVNSQDEVIYFSDIFKAWGLG